MTFELVVWDFDGVLNRNIVDGRFVWADRLQDDFGLDPQEFSDFVFRSQRIAEVIRGQRDLMEVTQDWLDRQNATIRAPEFLAYWFEHDALPDHEVTNWLRLSKQRKVIGTNNETRRATYIEHEMGYGPLVEKLFSSGRLCAAKPDAEFWQAIEAWSGLSARDILLIDDSKANVHAAADRGWRVFHFCEQSRNELPKLLGIG